MVICTFVRCAWDFYHGAGYLVDKSARKLAPDVLFPLAFSEVDGSSCGLSEFLSFLPSSYMELCGKRGMVPFSSSVALRFYQERFFASTSRRRKA